MKKTLVVLINIIITVLFFTNNYKMLLNNLSQEASTKETYINAYIQSVTQLVDNLILYGEIYFSHDNKNDSKFYSMLKYNPKTNTYNLNAVQNTPYEKLVGNLNGIGPIPSEGIYRDEISLVLECNEFFRDYRLKFQNIDWIYYISENNFICAYPWAPLTSVAYSEKLKLRDAYKLATPINNPNRDRVWTPVHLDASGKETLVTLSKPLYHENQFMGVVSVNITNKFLRDSIKSNNMFYLFDDSGTILITNQKSDKTDLLTMNDSLNISDYNVKALINIDKDSVRQFESYYVYVIRCQNAPWTMVVMTPIWKVFLKASLYTLPLILIGVFMVLALYEIARRKEAENELVNQATKDSLTGTYNRRYFMNALNKEVASALELGQELSLIMLDIDFFKKINDNLGHAKGDEILISISSILKSSIRSSDILSRWGGEEFIALLPSTEDKYAYQIAERIRKAISKYDFGIPWSVTCSFGVATLTKNLTIGELINNADKALYEAKNSGRNKVVLYKTL